MEREFFIGVSGFHKLPEKIGEVLTLTKGKEVIIYKTLKDLCYSIFGEELWVYSVPDDVELVLGKQGWLTTKLRFKERIDKDLNILRTYITKENKKYLFSWAAGVGRLDIIQLLLNEYGLTVNSKTKEKQRAILSAALQGQLPIVKFLVEHGAWINVKAAGNATPLFFASSMGHTEVVRYLLEKGAKVNCQSLPLFGGDTALTRAESKGHREIVGLLKNKKKRL